MSHITLGMFYSQIDTRSSDGLSIQLSKMWQELSKAWTMPAFSAPLQWTNRQFDLLEDKCGFQDHDGLGYLIPTTLTLTLYVFPISTLALLALNPALSTMNSVYDCGSSLFQGEFSAAQLLAIDSLSNLGITVAFTLATASAILIDSIQFLTRMIATVAEQSTESCGNLSVSPN